MAAFELEKAAYEIVYEAGHRPAWLPIPVRGLVSAAARLRAAGIFCFGVKSMVFTSHTASSNTTNRPSSYR